jgi:hypothetical protein
MAGVEGRNAHSTQSTLAVMNQPVSLRKQLRYGFHGQIEPDMPIMAIQFLKPKKIS